VGSPGRGHPDPGFAPAKINLFLHIVGKRPDGYHLLDSLAVFAAVGDLVSAAPAEDLSLSVTGRFAALLGGETDNLILRAARALAAEAGIVPRARLMLEKILPVASGIGGGSSDAAATLRLLCGLWDMPADLAVLSPLATALGADVPVCLRREATRMGGIGERLDPAPALPDCGLVLVNPGVVVSTALVFRSRQAAFSAPAVLPEGWLDAAAMAADLRALSNDLEAPAIALCPAIADVLATLCARPDCLLARMSGSGATCFGLYPSPEAARHAAVGLARKGWWVWGGGLRRGKYRAS
jgi:4-diphosphocytidyl-2-C-methyl-D-erythritol kinase